MPVNSNSRRLSFFFFNDTATTEIYTLSLHDALPNSRVPRSGITNWLTADQASAMTTPSANMSRTIGGSDAGRVGVAPSAPARPAAGDTGARRPGNVRVSTSVATSDTMTG